MAAGCRTFGLQMTALLFLVSCAATPRVVTPPVDTVPPPEQPPVEAAQQPDFVATEELKRKTFEEVSELISALDTIIANGDFSQWLGFLTDEYARSRSSASFLAQASESAVLKKNGIVLKTLKDYFENVVVRSRVQATLAELVFVDATHVKAYTRVQGTLYILYYLVREGDWWKIGVLPAENPESGETGA